MRLLRGLGSQLLPCGCLAGVYETYGGTTVSILDARADQCVHEGHRPGVIVPVLALLPDREIEPRSGQRTS